MPHTLTARWYHFAEEVCVFGCLTVSDAFVEKTSCDDVAATAASEVDDVFKKVLTTAKVSILETDLREDLYFSSHGQSGEH